MAYEKIKSTSRPKTTAERRAVEIGERMRKNRDRIADIVEHYSPRSKKKGQ